MTEKYWELWDIQTGNLIGYTSDPIEAGEWWVLTITDKTIALNPDIDCEGDCCAENQCKFGLKGGPSCSGVLTDP